MENKIQATEDQYIFFTTKGKIDAVISVINNINFYGLEKDVHDDIVNAVNSLEAAKEKILTGYEITE